MRILGIKVGYLAIIELIKLFGRKHPALPYFIFLLITLPTVQAIDQIGALTFDSIHDSATIIMPDYDPSLTFLLKKADDLNFLKCFEINDNGGEITFKYDPLCSVCSGTNIELSYSGNKPVKIPIEVDCKAEVILITHESKLKKNDNFRSILLEYAKVQALEGRKFRYFNLDNELDLEKYFQITIPKKMARYIGTSQPLVQHVLLERGKTTKLPSSDVKIYLEKGSTILRITDGGKPYIYDISKMNGKTSIVDGVDSTKYKRLSPSIIEMDTAGDIEGWQDFYATFHYTIWLTDAQLLDEFVAAGKYIPAISQLQKKTNDEYTILLGNTDNIPMPVYLDVNNVMEEPLHPFLPIERVSSWVPTDFKYKPYDHKNGKPVIARIPDFTENTIERVLKTAIEYRNLNFSKPQLIGDVVTLNDNAYADKIWGFHPSPPYCLFSNELGIPCKKNDDFKKIISKEKFLVLKVHGTPFGLVSMQTENELLTNLIYASKTPFLWQTQRTGEKFFPLNKPIFITDACWGGAIEDSMFYETLVEAVMDEGAPVYIGSTKLHSGSLDFIADIVKEIENKPRPIGKVFSEIQEKYNFQTDDDKAFFSNLGFQFYGDPTLTIRWA